MGLRPWATGLSAPAYWAIESSPLASAWSHTQPDPKMVDPLVSNSFWKAVRVPHWVVICFSSGDSSLRSE